MAKDGTNRGGMRIGAGKKRKPSEDNLIDGTAIFAPKTAKKKPKKYLTAKQADGGKLCAKRIYEEIAEWIAAHGCAAVVPTQLIADYAMATARHIQCESYLSQFGLLSKHPTTGEPISSPFFKMSNECLKLSSQLWYQIYTAVKENAPHGIIVSDPEDDMEKLFREAGR